MFVRVCGGGWLIGGGFALQAESQTVACINSRVDRRRRVARVSDEHRDDGMALGGARG